MFAIVAFVCRSEHVLHAGVGQHADEDMRPAFDGQIGKRIASAVPT